MYFQETVECPECGFHTHELNVINNNLLVCDDCVDESYEDWREKNND